MPAPVLDRVRIAPSRVLPRPALLALLALAIGLGALSGAGFPPRSSPALIAFGLFGVLVLLRHRSAGQAALLGLAFGLGWFGVVLEWARVIGPDAWVLLTLACAAFYAAAGAGMAVAGRLPLGPLWAACIWVLMEQVRDRIPFGGFPWARVSDGLDAGGGALAATVRIVGFTGLSFLVVLVCATAASVLCAVRLREPLVPAVLVPVLVCGAVLLVPLRASAVVDDAPARGSITVALVQGDVPGTGLDFLGRRRAVLDNHVLQTRRLAGEVAAGRVAQPDLVVWPENSTDIDPLRDPVAGALIDNAVRAVGAPVLLGAVLDGPGPDRVRNAAVLWRPGAGPEVVYIKQRPVPFGEVVPFRAQLSSLISRFDRVPRDFAAGDEPGVVDVAGARLGLAICFEVAHDDVLPTTVRQGADLLVVLTNNATYSATDQPEQQFAITAQRAAELDRTTVVAATTGITAALDASGGRIAALPQDEPGFLVQEVALRTGLSPAARAGEGIATALAIVGSLAVLLGGLTARRRRGPAVDPAEQESA